MTYWPPLDAKTEATHSLPNPENERQSSINDFKSCIVGNPTGDWLETSINQKLAAFRGKNITQMLPAPSRK